MNHLPDNKYQNITQAPLAEFSIGENRQPIVVSLMRQLEKHFGIDTKEIAIYNCLRSAETIVQFENYRIT